MSTIVKLTSRQQRFGLKLCDLLSKASPQGYVPLSNGKRVLFNMACYRNDCNTIGCALGIAGLEPWFRRRGLRTRLAASFGLGVTFPGMKDALSSAAAEAAFGSYAPFNNFQSGVGSPLGWAAKWRPAFKRGEIDPDTV